MNNACVIGYGMVGKAMAEVFGIEKHFDIIAEKSNMTLEDAAKCSLVFVCLPTPSSSEGTYETDGLVKIINQIESYGSDCTYVIRSTVFPGFALALQQTMGINRIISNPEFLSEATAVEDVKNPPFILIGGAEGKYRAGVRAFYEARIKGAPVIETDNTTAEMAKLALNSFFATKVVFANQTYDACKVLGANYETVRKILEAHPFGPTNHFKVWFRNKRGVHGACLPKDMRAFAFYAHSDLVKRVVELNNRYIHLKDDNELPTT